MNKKILYGIIIPQIIFSQSLDMNEISSLSRSKAQSAFKEYREFLSLPNDANKQDELIPNMIWCEKAFQKRGFTTERLKTKRLPLILAEKKYSGAKNTVLFYIQIDGQPVDPSKWFQEGPFIPTLKKQVNNDNWETIPWESLYKNYDDDWRIFARSASDAKGPINSFLIALDIIEEKKIQPDYNIKVIMDMEEEMGSPNLPPAVKKFRKKLKADRLVILDGPRHPSNEPTLTFGARGIVTIQLKVHGPKFPQHSGHYGNYVPNPAIRLSQLIASMKDDDGRVTIPGYYDGITISEEARAIMSAVPDDEQFIKMKPSIIYLLFGGILGFGLLRGQSYLRMIMQDMIPLKEEGWIVLTRRFAVFFFSLALLNEIIWRFFSTEMWVYFKTFGLTIALFAFFVLQGSLLNKYAIEKKE